MSRLMLLAAVASLVLVVNDAARANPGDLDPTFGQGGIVTAFAGAGSVVNSVALQPDGRVVAGGFGVVQNTTPVLALVRYNQGGSVDSSFGADGVATTVIGRNLGSSFGLAVVVHPDGKLVAASYTYTPAEDERDIVLVRYDADGRVDPTFGSAGLVRTPIGPVHSGAPGNLSLVLQADGKVVAGTPVWTGSKYDFALFRYHTDGAPDAGFGAGGMVTTAVGPGIDSLTWLMLQADGKLVAAGESATLDVDPYVAPPLPEVALVRYETDGNLDPSFGTGGKVTTDIHTLSFAPSPDRRGAMVQTDGKIVAAGSTYSDLTVLRYESDGTPDVNFGTNGRVTMDVGGADDLSQAVLQQADGKIVVVLNARRPDYWTISLVRLEPDGRLDATFGTGGKVSRVILGTDSIAYGAVMQPDGKVVVGGLGSGQYGSQFELARFLGDECPTCPPTTTSTSTTSTTSSTALHPTNTTTTTIPIPRACIDPISLPPDGGTFLGTTAGASSLAGSCAASRAAPEVVYAWTPAVSGAALIQTCSATLTTFDTVLYLRRGTCVAGTEVACNDDTPGCGDTRDVSNPYHGSRLTPSVAAGETYFIVVDGYATSRGTFLLTVLPPPAPPLPTTCDTPIPLPAEGGTFLGTTSGGSTLAGTCAATSSAPEVVYQWTPTASGTAIIETCSATLTTFDTVLYLRHGTCAAGAEVACNDDTSGCGDTHDVSNPYHGSRITPTVTAGQTYFIVVDGYATSRGSFALTVSPPP